MSRITKSRIMGWIGLLSVAGMVLAAAFSVIRFIGGYMQAGVLFNLSAMCFWQATWDMRSTLEGDE